MLGAVSIRIVKCQEDVPVGFIDDNKDLQGSNIADLKVYSINDIEELIHKLKVNEVLVALPSASRSDRFSIIDKLDIITFISSYATWRDRDGTR